MRQIRITVDIEQLVNETYKGTLMGDAWKNSVETNLDAVANKFRNATSLEINIGNAKNPNWQYINPQVYVTYINQLKLEYTTSDLVIVKPSGFNDVIERMEAIVTRDNVGKPIKLNGVPIDSFSKQIVKALRFDDVRDKVMPPIYRHLGLKSCVYCNANYTIADKKNNGYYDLDHWKPKALYPYFAVTFYNLQPSCAPCNRRKSDSDEKYFGLWNDNDSTDLNVLNFELEERSLVNYLVFLENQHLKINLKPANINDADQENILNEAKKKLHIEERYAEHNDYVEEIVWKCMIYNDSMIQSLRDSEFSCLIPTDADLKRFILGTYTDEKDIHRRPLTRLSIDMAKQLGLI